MNQLIEFDKGKAHKLQRAYDKAVEDGDEWFMFEDNKWFTRYAYYVLEYMKEEGVLAP